MNQHIIDLDKADIRKRNINRSRPGYKRGSLERKVDFRDWKEAPEGECCTYCRNLLSSPPRGVHSMIGKVVQLNRKEWCHSVCYWTNVNPAHSFGFATWEQNGGGRWRRVNK